MWIFAHNNRNQSRISPHILAFDICLCWNRLANDLYYFSELRSLFDNLPKYNAFYIWILNDFIITQPSGLLICRASLIYRLRHLWGSRKLGTQSNSRWKSNRCYVEMGTLQKRECCKYDWFYRETSAQANTFIFVQKTLVSGSVHGFRWPGWKRTFVSSSSSWLAFGQIPCNRKRSGKLIFYQ